MRTTTSPVRARRTLLRLEAANSRACTLESRRLTLWQLPSFRALPGPDFRRLSVAFWERHLQLGDVICRQGEPATRLYLLSTGRARLKRAGVGNAPVLPDIFGPAAPPPRRFRYYSGTGLILPGRIQAQMGKLPTEAG